MYCFEANNCNNFDCPVRKNKIKNCWRYFSENLSGKALIIQKTKCDKCNYRLGWEIGLISEDTFKNKENIIHIEELIPKLDFDKNEKIDISKTNKKRFCYEIMDCDNKSCPVREQQIIRCFKYFEPKSREEKLRLTCCNRDCENCFYKGGWDIGLLSEDNFTDVIKAKKLKLEHKNRLQKNLIVEIYMAELAKKPLSHKEEIQLAKKIAGDKNASEVFLLANLKLVTRIAKKFPPKIPFMDLIQEGNIGLIKAISKFDYTLGYKFSTYAAYWIKYYMQKAIAEQSSSINIPCHLIAISNKIKNHIRKFEEQLNRAPTLEELSEILGIPEEKIINIINVTKTPVSIHSKVSSDENEEETIEYYIEDKKTLTPEEALIEKYKTKAIEDALDNNLNDRQRFVVKNFYGINCEEITLAEIGRQINITRERARQILQASLSKLSQLSSIISLKE